MRGIIVFLIILLISGKVFGNEIEIIRKNGEQQNPQVIYIPAYDLYFMVWEDWSSGNADIYGRFIKPDGTFCGDEFRIDQDAGNDLQTHPGVAYSLKSNTILVAWQDSRGTSTNGYVYYRGIQLPVSIDCNTFNPLNDLTFSSEQAVSSISLTGSDNLVTRLKPRVIYNISTDEFIIVWTEIRDINKVVTNTCNFRGLSLTYQFITGDDTFLGFTRVNALTFSQGIPEILNVRFVGTEALDDDNIIHIYEIFNDITNPSIACDITSGICGLVFEAKRERFSVTCKCQVVGANDNVCDSDGDDFIVAKGEVGVFQQDLAPYRQHIFFIFLQHLNLQGYLFSRVDYSNETDANNPYIAFDYITKRFLVVWEDRRDNIQNPKIYGQLIDITGTFYGENFIISFTDLDGDGLNDPEVLNTNQTNPVITFDDVNQRFFVVWQDGRNQSISLENLDIYGQLIDPEGTLRGSNTFITTAPGNQLSPSLTYNPNNNEFFIVWKDGRNKDTTGSDIYARRLPVGQPQLIILEIDRETILSPPLLNFGTINVGGVTTRSFRIKNAGDVPLKLYDLNPVSLTAPFFYENIPTELSDGDMNTFITLLPSAELTFTISFKPKNAETYTEEFTIITNAGNKKIYLQGVAIAPDLTISEGDGVNDGILDFGDVNVGESKDLILTIINNGTISYTITSITGIQKPFEIVGGLQYPRLTPGSQFTMTLRFTPNKRGNFTSSLRINTDIPDLNVSIILKGRGVAPELKIPQDTIDFGAINIGITATLELSIENVGELPLNIISCGSPKPPFSIVSCPQTVQPGTVEKIVYSFSPQDIQTYSDTVTIETEVGKAYITLTGSGKGPKIEVDREILDFGYVAVGSFRTLKVTVTNAGNETLKIADIDTSNLKFPFFINLPVVLPVELLPGTSLDIFVSFSPSEAGFYNGSFTILTNSRNVTVNLQGVAAELDLKIPAEVDFGTAEVGDIITKSISIVNDSFTELSILEIIAPEEPFSIVSNIEAPYTLGPGETIDLLIRFEPVEPGDFTDSIKIIFDKLKNPVNISLFGKSSDKPIITSLIEFIYEGNSIDILDFREVFTGNEEFRKIVIRNVSSEEIYIESFSITPPFNTILNVPLSLSPGEETSILISFKPDAAGIYKGELSLKDNKGREILLGLSGIGVDLKVESTSPDVEVQYSTLSDQTVNIPDINPLKIIRFTAFLNNDTVKDVEIKVYLAYEVQNPEVYKIISDSFKKIYPENECSNISNVKFEGNVLTFTIKDNGECDINKTEGIIVDPIVIGVRGQQQTPVTPTQPVGAPVEDSNRAFERTYGGGCNSHSYQYAFLITLLVIFRIIRRFLSP